MDSKDSEQQQAYVYQNINSSTGHQVPPVSNNHDSFVRSYGSDLNPLGSFNASNPKQMREHSTDESGKQPSPLKSSQQEIPENSTLDWNNGCQTLASPQKENPALNGFSPFFICKDKNTLVIGALTKDPLCYYEKEVGDNEIKSTFGKEMKTFFSDDLEAFKRNLEDAVRTPNNKDNHLRVGISQGAEINIKSEVSLGLSQKKSREMIIQLERKAEGPEIEKRVNEKIQSFSGEYPSAEKGQKPKLIELIEHQCQILKELNKFPNQQA